MKKTVIAIFFCTALCTAVFAQNASDFKTDGKGTITGYEGWDKVITIPEKIGNVTITAIATKAFERLDFTDLTLPASIKTIGESAFSGSKLTSITLPSGVTIGDRAFASNQLTSLTIPSGVTIGEGAFSNNNLTSLTILADVTIGVSAFADNKLNTIAVGDRVTIDAGSFYGNPLTSVTIGSGGIIYTGYDRYITFNNSNLKTLNLGEGINFKSTVFNIGAYYDYLCNSKKAGTYDNTVRYSEKTEGDYTFIPTTYGAVITRYNGGLQAVQIPAVLGGKAVKGIVGEDYVGAFMRRNITRIQLPDGLAFIDGGAFSDNQLTSVTIPNIRKIARFT